MEYSPKEPLLHPALKGTASCFTRIIHLVVTMLLISACTVLLVVPTVFMTLFIFGSFQANTMKVQQQSSALLAKIRPSNLGHGKIISSPIIVKYSELTVDIENDSTDEMRLLVKNPGNAIEQQNNHRIQRSVEVIMQRYSTKDIVHLIDVLQAIQIGEQNLDNISEKDKIDLNYLMDNFGIEYARARRSVSLHESYEDPDESYVLTTENYGDYSPNVDEPLNVRLSTTTLYRLIDILNDLDMGKIKIDDVDYADSNIFNSLMDMFGM